MNIKKYILTLLLVSSSALADSKPSELTEVLASGITQIKAAELCRESKMRLPAVRELIELNPGRMDIRETTYPNIDQNDSKVQQEILDMKNAGYNRILKRNDANARVINFYYKRSQIYTLWSASEALGSEDSVYAFDQSLGEFYIEKIFNYRGDLAV